MQLKLSFVAGLIASSLALAAPVAEEKGINVELTKRDSLTNGSGHVDFGKVDRHINALRAKYQKNLDNYQRNTGASHRVKRSLPEHLEKRATGSVPLTDVSNELLWTGKIAYGTPAQSFNIDFDTGSSDTLVNAGTYRPGSSSTSVKTSKAFSTAYGDGTTAKGTVYTDALTIGGLTASRVAIGLSTTTFVTDSAGISGMAFPNLAQFGSAYPPFFYSLKNQGKLNAGVFQFTLAKTGSSLYLGGTDASKYSGSFTWSPVDSSQGFWLTSASVNGLSIDSIVDTGTTVIVAPTNEAQSLFNRLGLDTFTQDNQLYGAYDCNSPPRVTFNYSGKAITLSGDTVKFGTTTDGSCVLSVVGGDVGISAWVTGDSLLQNTVAAFDVDNSRVGFATKR
ncbi:uncharacterized protein PFL1_00598 [Pseudozyma flocculosa PF-1]|uniref:Related to pepsin (Aspartate protease) n=1 Tax=Pseudozyma flocculosa TaxID=84751 RepID=A0A5C3ERB3_9BASI|nr:uncharacterized protein PFL1_00598 [Pseudozyma flocculosa PF-1]EPQ32402.1 hypothetical protein PFL1_00598 [Pseudozyma flocculosa PF-1]SPO34622.1 related to pepsin precursor (aspartate protease) [Pseudozyma flocculosa]